MLAPQSDLPIALLATLINIQEVFFLISTSINHECTRNRGLGVFEFSLIRNSCNLIFAIPIFLYFGRGLTEGLTTEKWVPLVIRIVCGNITFFTFTYVFKLLPLGIGQVIIQSNPFVVVLLSNYFLNEPVHRFEIVCITLTFLGIFIMAVSHPDSETIDEKTES
jgi:drug/metabolite transporter (DMT)-like permease